MKIPAIEAIAAIIFLMLLVTPARSADWSVTKEPGKNEKIHQELAVISSFALIDYYQSRQMYFDGQGYYEMNPILGPAPTRASMIGFGLAGIGVFYILATTLPEPWRQLAVDSIIASEQLNIQDNRRLYQGWNTEGPPLRGRTVDGIPVLVSFRF